MLTHCATIFDKSREICCAQGSGLLYHNDVNLKQKIDFIGRKILWPEIARRLREAVTNTQKIFQKKDQSLDLKKSQKLSEDLKQKGKEKDLSYSN